MSTPEELDYDLDAGVEPRELIDLLHENEIRRIAVQVDQDFRDGVTSHTRRIERFKSYLRRWRNIAEQQDPEDEASGRSNMMVPLLQWAVFSKWSMYLDSLFGDDAEITAEPVGESDSATAAKVGLFMDWRVFNDMKLVNPFSVMTFRALLFGRAHAYAPWEQRGYWVWDRDPMTGARVRRRVISYTGPGFYPLSPDDLIVPAETAETIYDFSWVIRKFRATPQELLDGEAAGLYAGVSEHWEEIVRGAEQGLEVEAEGDEMKLEEQFLEQVDRDSTGTATQFRGKLRVYEWFGTWRLPEKLSADVQLSDVRAREKMQTELRVFYLPDLDLVIGIDDLAEIFPQCEHRRPFVELSTVKDGSYWCMGAGEMLEELQDETSEIHRNWLLQGEFAAGPLIFARPTAGIPVGQSTVIRPRTMITTEDPSGVNVVQIRGDAQFPMQAEQAHLGFAERVYGVSDQNLGRAIDRPNAPKTASGQLALIEQGNIRVSIETRWLREDMSAVLSWFWTLEQMFGSEQQFFRVTEEDARDLFEVRNGGATLTDQERRGRFDFRVKFASGYWSREAAKERFLTLYPMLAQNPLVMQNPPLLAAITKELCKQLGYSDLAKLIVMPPAADLPKSPKEEWTLMLEGRGPVKPHPQDNDAEHLAEHQQQLASGADDPAAVAMLEEHIALTEQQMAQKAAMAALAQQLMPAAAE